MMAGKIFFRKHVAEGFDYYFIMSKAVWSLVFIKITKNLVLKSTTKIKIHNIFLK